MNHTEQQKKANLYIKENENLSLKEIEKIIDKDFGDYSLDGVGIYDIVRSKLKNRKYLNEETEKKYLDEKRERDVFFNKKTKEIYCQYLDVLSDRKEREETKKEITEYYHLKVDEIDFVRFTGKPLIDENYIKEELNKIEIKL